MIIEKINIPNGRADQLQSAFKLLLGWNSDIMAGAPYVNLVDAAGNPLRRVELSQDKLSDDSVVYKISLVFDSKPAPAVAPYGGYCTDHNAPLCSQCGVCPKDPMQHLSGCPKSH